MGQKKEKDIPYHIYTVESTYDSFVDDWMLDSCEPTQMIIRLSGKTSNDQICNELSLNRRHYITHISKNEIYVVSRSNNKPKYCLKKV